jgi:AI-2 transport protein TqsA
VLGERGVTQEQINAAVSQFDLNSLVGVLQRVVTGATGVVSDLAFILALLFFLILDSSSFPDRLAAAAQRPHLVEALTGFARATRQYIVVSTVFGLIVALVDVAALYWLDVPLPWLWGLLAFITNYIPNIGFVLGLIPPALLALLQGGVRQAVLVVVAYSVINVMIQSLLQPKFVGDAVGAVGDADVPVPGLLDLRDRAARGAARYPSQPVRQGAPRGRRPGQPLA